MKYHESMGNKNSHPPPTPGYRVVAKLPQHMKKKPLSLSESVIVQPLKDNLRILSERMENERQMNDGILPRLFAPQPLNNASLRHLSLGNMSRNPNFLSNLVIDVNAPPRAQTSPQPREPMTPPTPAIAIVENPCGRYVHSTCSHKNNLYLFGGYNGHIYLNDLYRFDIIKKEWKLISGCDSSPTHPHRRSDHHLAYRSATHEIVLFGGWADPDRLNDTWLFDLSTAKWRRHIVPNEKIMFENGLTLASQLYHQKSDSMIIFGGQYSGDESNRMFQLSFKDNTWYQLLPGGISSEEPVNNSDFSRRRNDASSSTQELSNGYDNRKSAPEPRENTTAVWYQNENFILIYGGWADNRCLNDMWLFNMNTHTWTEVIYENEAEEETPQPRGGHASVMINDRYLYVYGGFNHPNYHNDLWIFDMEIRKWFPVSFSNAQTEHVVPGGSWFHTMNLLTENDRDIPSIVLFGGEDCNSSMLDQTLVIQPDELLRKHWYPNHSYRRLLERISGSIQESVDTVYSDVMVQCQS